MKTFWGDKHPNDEDSTHLWNVGIFQRDCTAYITEGFTLKSLTSQLFS
jgi:hypothetical protein